MRSNRPAPGTRHQAEPRLAKEATWAVCLADCPAPAFHGLLGHAQSSFICTALKVRLNKLITNAVHDGGVHGEQSQIVTEYIGEGRFDVNFANAAYEPRSDSV